MELRYFGGLSVEETAVTLELSADTVMRELAPQSLVARRNERATQTMTPERWREIGEPSPPAIKGGVVRSRTPRMQTNSERTWSGSSVSSNQTGAIRRVSRVGLRLELSPQHEL